MGKGPIEEPPHSQGGETKKSEGENQRVSRNDQQVARPEKKKRKKKGACIQPRRVDKGIEEEKRKARTRNRACNVGTVIQDYK